MSPICVADLRLVLDPDSVREVKHGRFNNQITKLKRFHAFLGDVRIGHVERTMQTFQQKTPGRTYVNRRWTSPRWKAHLDGARSHGAYYETKSGAVEALVWRHNMHHGLRENNA